MKMPSAAWFLFFTALGGWAAAAEWSLEIDKEHSFLRVDVTSTMVSFVAKLDPYDLVVSLDPEEGRVTYAQLRFRFSDLKTGSTRRDLDMREWEGIEQFPEGVYWTTSVDRTTDGKLTARGKFLFHGQTRDFAVPFRLKTDDKKSYTLDGETEMDTRDFGLSLIRKFGLLKVEPMVKIRFHFQGGLPLATAPAP